MIPRSQPLRNLSEQKVLKTIQSSLLPLSPAKASNSTVCLSMGTASASVDACGDSVLRSGGQADVAVEQSIKNADV